MIYFVQVPSGPIKIGYASDVASRLRNIQTNNHERCELLFSMQGDEWREDLLHQLFEADRIAGEWFRPSPRLLALIEEMRAAEDPHDAMWEGVCEKWAL